jgi:type I restriction enzyme, S subunit
LRCTQTLGDICDEVGGIIRTGPFGSQLHQSDYADEGIPVVMPKDIVGGRVATGGIARVAEETADRLQQHRMSPGDIVYGRRGDIGRRALITDREVGWLCGTGCLRISLGDSIIDPTYLYYYLDQPGVISWIYNQAVGATMPNLNTGILRSVEVTYPPLPTQRRISSILSAYDDLIENNTRRIAILEEMAQSLYREWFVHFRYPGHEHVPLVDSPLDPVPEGWEVKQLGQLAIENRRSITPDDIDPDTPYVGLEHIPRKSIALSEWGQASSIQSTKLQFQKGEILFGKIRPYFHKVSVAPIDGVCSTDTIVISAIDPAHYPLVLCCVSSEAFVDHATQTSQGTKMPRANWNVLVKYDVAVPPCQLLSSFNAVVQDTVAEIQCLVMKTRNLRRTRDLLLPKLIAGEVDVTSALHDAHEASMWNIE